MNMVLSDSDSSSECSSYDDHDDVEYLYSGHACSILSSLEKSISSIDDFLSFERVFTYGDIVNDPYGKMGKVVNVDMSVDLENIYGGKIRKVNSKSLLKIHSVSVGDYVVNGPWLGKVERVMDKVTVLFDDGAKVEFNNTEMLTPVSHDLVEDSQYPFYPGQRVHVQFLSTFLSAEWLYGGKRDQATVCALDTGLVYVDWIGCVDPDRQILPTPLSTQVSENLTLLSCFSHAKWQLGDWCVLPDADSNIPQVAVISKARTKVDVLWQDGSLTRGRDSDSLFPVNVVDAHEFWPEQFVIEKGVCDDTNFSDAQKWGVVRCVDAKERLVKVKWNTFRGNELNNFKEEQIEETVSAYELMDHADYLYCLGDVVFKSCEDQYVGFVHGKILNGMDLDSGVKHIDTRKDQQNLPNDYLSHIGIIVGFRDGKIEVKWATGFTSMAAPFEIYRIDKCEGAATTRPYGENGEQSNVAMDFQDKQLSKQGGKDMLNFVDDGASFKEKLGDSRSCSFHAAIGFFSSATSSLFSSLGTSLFGMHQCTSEDVESCNLNGGFPTLELGALRTSSETELQNLKDSEDQKYYDSPSLCNLPEQFRQFEMVNGFSDHHFADGAGKAVPFSQVRRGWLKKVQQEWSILENGLPETISVRACEQRMNLLRAAIVGAPGTPYHDGLFFFDICLPPDYPQEPPMVHYISGGLRVNPNLYESGKVCLSLLNTWTGTGNEAWNPNSSTLLQVLLSLQALVLNEKPYFNEAGYDTLIGKADGEKNSVGYNENAFVVTCKSMLYLLRNPPKHFEALVEEHFNRRWEHILLTCKAYMSGALIGSAFQPKNETMEGCSTGFKIMVGKLFPKLVEAFSDKGIDCTQLFDQQ